MPCKAPYNYQKKKKKWPCLYQCWVVTWFGQLERPVLVLVSENQIRIRSDFWILVLEPELKLGLKPNPILEPELKPGLKPNPILEPELKPGLKPSPILEPELKQVLKPSPILEPELKQGLKPNPILEPELNFLKIFCFGKQIKKFGTEG